ncbi:hypothetical protein D3C71_2156210 [compost metagenome]
MADMHHQVAPLAEPFNHPRSLCGGLLDVGKRPWASRKIVVLDINDHQCFFV